MQAYFPGIPGWTAGAIGLGHLTSKDLATWVVAPPALVPGRWGGPIGTVGQVRAPPSCPLRVSVCSFLLLLGPLPERSQPHATAGGERDGGLLQRQCDAGRRGATHHHPGCLLR